MGGKTGASGIAFGAIFFVATLLRCSSSNLHRVVRISTDSARSLFSVATFASSDLQASRSTLRFSFSNSSGVRARVCLTFFCCLILEEVVTGGKLGAGKDDIGDEIEHDKELLCDSVETVTVGEVMLLVLEVRGYEMLLGMKGSAFLLSCDTVKDIARAASSEDITSSGAGATGKTGEPCETGAETFVVETDGDGKAKTEKEEEPGKVGEGMLESRARVLRGGQSSGSLIGRLLFLRILESGC